MPTIRVEDDVFEGLKKLAEPFVDTPSSVIRKLLEQKGVLEPREKPTTAARIAPKHSNTGPHTLTPQPVYEDYLLATLDQDFNGRAHKREVTLAVIEKMRANGLIGPADLEFVATGETKAENTIAWGRNALKERGYISRITPRGMWELTPEGRAAAKKIQLAKKRS